MKFSDYGPLFTPRIIGIIVLITAGLIALGIAFVRGANAYQRYWTGWKALTQRFPAADVHKFGGRYKRRSGFFGGSSKNCVSGMFLIELAQEGFLVTANFARTPILIPWSAIRDITEMNVFGFMSMNEITVDYEDKLSFTIPKDALTAIQESVPAERFHKAVFSELLKNTLLKELRG
jgi:hypothetical protein